MDNERLVHFQDRLLEKKDVLTEFIRDSPVAEIKKLLTDIDDALIRIQNGTYGICEECHDAIEFERLEVDPLLVFCLDHLTTKQQRNLEADLTLAAKIQKNLLPSKNLKLKGWDIAYHYEPAGLVSGDYCDIILTGDDECPFYMVLGDVSGKGVSASMLMNQLHAMFHTLTSLKLHSNELMEKMNRVLCESTLDDHYATLLLAIVQADGNITISNAGHCHPILFNETSQEIESSGIPLGVLHDSTYDDRLIKMNSGDTLFLYTDGLIEAMKEEEMYGTAPLMSNVIEIRGKTSKQIIENTLKDLHAFLGNTVKNDDLTIMVLKKL